MTSADRTCVIVSKRDNLATDPNFQTIHNYFELGWEMGASRIDCLHLFASGKIRPETHAIVTLRDRMFLYSTLMPVLAYEDWAKERRVTDASNLPKSRTMDLTHFYASTAAVRWEVFHYGPERRYRYEEMVRNLYDHFQAPGISDLTDQPYFVCCWRYRNSHHAERNTPESTARTLHQLLLNHAPRIYVVGLGAEGLCNGKEIVHVDLPRFCALVRQPNCRAVVGAMTGTMQFAAIACRSKVAVYQHNPQEPVNVANHPVVLGECVNFHRNKRLIRYEPQTHLASYMPELEHFITS